MSAIAAFRAEPLPAAVDIGRLAVRALHAELTLYPKPGLVSPVDSGSHSDMDASTFQRSLFALRRTFVELAAAGAAGAPFAALREIGIAGEACMLAATGGVNTHRGAIFTLGLLAASAGYRHRRGLSLGAGELADTIVSRWGRDIAIAGATAPASNGSRVTRRHGLRGARDEALDGFPILVGVAAPVLRRTLHALRSRERALVQTLFATMAELQDTNVVHRGGMEGLGWLQREARRFLDAGGVFAADWRQHAVTLHHACVARRLSPGGAADTLAAAWFIHELSA